MFKENSLGDQAAVRRSSRRVWSNRTAGFLVTLGGAAVIAVVVAIFVFIGFETLPLWDSPEIHRLADVHHGLKDVLLVAENEYRTLGVAVARDGNAVLFQPRTGSIVGRVRLLPDESTVSAARADLPQKYILILDSRRRAIILELPGSYPHLREDVTDGLLRTVATLPIDLGEVKLADFSSLEDEFLIMAADVESAVAIYRVESEGISLGSTPVVNSGILRIDGGERVTGIALDRYGEKALVATSEGILTYWDVRDLSQVSKIQSVQASRQEITAVKFLLGGQSVIIGDTSGGVSTWTWALDSSTTTGIGLVPLNSFDPHPAPVMSVGTALRNKSFVTGDALGQVFLRFQTAGKTLLRFQPGGSQSPIQQVSISPRGDGLMILAADGTIFVDSLYNPHPEASFEALFGRIQYEGYRAPTYTWQSTGGTDDFESKLSLIPLIFGTVKGAVYAMIFALPIAVLAALYTALFSHPRIRNLIKPVVEIMAALPSVVVGFIAALWLAPILEKHFVSAALMVLTFPLSVLMAVAGWRLFPSGLRNRLVHGSEIAVLVPVMGGVLYLTALLGPLVETALFDGSFRQWLFETMSVTYDQRNSLVVGFAMGFAVIPIIFTISEDALSSVPAHLTAGSLALGATRWQTAIRVVLPTASPGIFSAAMVGFGRAVGETMIVLMATGNTPLLDFGAFVGMRTLSANIAVEIPEAPYLGTLYRILFFSGLLLFAFTFLINTVAEIIRQRLRKQYSTI